MTVRSGWSYTLAPAARKDIGDVLRHSEEQFGDSASLRYEALLSQALRDLAVNPRRAGTQTRLEIGPDCFVYHLAHSKDRVQGDRVAKPRHFLFYRLSESSFELLRVLHDSRDLPGFFMVFKASS